MSRRLRWGTDGNTLSLLVAISTFLDVDVKERASDFRAGTFILTHEVLRPST
jgi:hypothetical protein